MEQELNIHRRMDMRRWKSVDVTITFEHDNYSIETKTIVRKHAYNKTKTEIINTKQKTPRQNNNRKERWTEKPCTWETCTSLWRLFSLLAVFCVSGAFVSCHFTSIVQKSLWIKFIYSFVFFSGIWKMATANNFDYLPLYRICRKARFSIFYYVYNLAVAVVLCASAKQRHRPEYHDET